MSQERRHSIEQKESPKAVLDRYLQSLALSTEDLGGKEVLDVGAGEGKFAEAVVEAGIAATVTSVDDTYNNAAMHRENPRVVKIDAQNLPFEDNTFDLVVSVAAVPNTVYWGRTNVGRVRGYTKHGTPEVDFSSDEYDLHQARAQGIIERVIRECLRVVKEDGEVRLGAVSDTLEYFEIEGMERGAYGLGEIRQEEIRNQNKISGLYILRKFTEEERKSLKSSSYDEDGFEEGYAEGLER